MTSQVTVDQTRPTTLVVPPNFPVTWEHPDDARLCWELDRMHCPNPLTPLSHVFALYCFEDGINSAAKAYGLPVRTFARRINTYLYWTGVPVVPPEDAGGRGGGAQGTMAMAMARLAELWERDWLPEIQQHVAYWKRFDLGRSSLPALIIHLDETAARVKRLWEIHFLAIFPAYVAVSTFDDLYRDLLGNDDSFEAFRLLQGFDNLTLASGRALWQLSRRALVSPSVRRILEDTAPADVPAALEQFPDGTTILAELGAYLNEYGQRSSYWIELSEPRWIEDPTPVIRNLQAYVRHPDRHPTSDLASLAAERDQLVAKARDRLAQHPLGVVGEFEAMLKAAQQGTVITEDHNFWIDYLASYWARRVVLELGRRFAEAGVLDTSDDVFYLTLEELRETARALPRIDRRAIVAGRRAELAYFRTISSPPAVGTPLSEPPPDDPFTRAIFGKFFGKLTQPSTEPQILRGAAGSPGTVRGRARVIRSLAEASKLQKGDVLVTEATMPPWTLLFATAVAVVTDVGGILSHCAVVAREYRIPAVVGTGTATSAIHDGQMLEVDGDAGVVRILSPM